MFLTVSVTSESVHVKEIQTKYHSIHKECLLCLLWCETGRPRQVLGPITCMSTFIL